ncbi:MAG TPA: transglutaminase family protein [Acetobacteraceae bacterium]|nr:transglutaminase family protein [Acetobacteraceae bacterium]
MIFRIRHTTRYAYGSAVDLAAHMLHLEPRPLPFQRVLAAGLHCDPAPAGQRPGIDHFGNKVTWLFLDVRHESFEVTAEAVVDVCFPTPPPADATLPWEEVAALARAGRDEAWRAAEYVFDSPMLPAEPAAGIYAAPSFPPGRPILTGLLDLNTRIRREFTFRPGVTTLVTPVSRVLKQREGVCQDFSHLMICALRALGLPARYVSGYLRTRPPPGKKRRQGTDQSHAWVSCWLGPQHGWVDLDPTNDLVVREEHVVLGWGRDYSDVSPLRGIILGGGTHSLAVSVDLEPEPPL